MANKADLVAKVIEVREAEGVKLTKKDATEVVNAVFEGITEFLSEGESVDLGNKFGSFHVKERAARKGRNLQTGEEIQIPATKVAKFKPKPSFKKLIKES